MKMWDGRFEKALDSRVNDFNSSIKIDRRMYREDIQGSIAHATMLGACGIIDKKEAQAICAALEKIREDLDSGRLLIDPEAEDIHMFIESVLTERIGDAGKKLHTARSRSDQVALDLRMYLKGEIVAIGNLIQSLVAVIVEKARENVDTVMPGYTHLQRAQPLTFAHHLLAYAQMFMRDFDRLRDTYRRTDVMPLGSGALAGTTYPIDRRLTASLLNFSAISDNSIDGVSDRDFAIELAAVLSITMMHLSRFSEEIILWCSSEFSFIELDDSFATGSSIMPQKKNPDIAELVRGKTGRVYGDLTALLTLMKGLPLAYNKDMQEDKEAIFDAVDNTKLCLEIFTSMLATIVVKKQNMRRAASHGFINATDCADYLVKQGLPFRDAYKISGRLVAYCIKQEKTLGQLSIDEFKAVCEELSLPCLFDENFYHAIDLQICVNERKVYGGPAYESVMSQIKIAEAFLEEKITE